MVDPSYSRVLSTQFGGAQTLPDPLSVPRTKALQSQNVSFVPGKVGTRLGFSLALVTTDAISAMFNWLSSLGNLLLWFKLSDRSVRYVDVAAPAVTTLIAGSLIGDAATFAEAG